LILIPWKRKLAVPAAQAGSARPMPAKDIGRRQMQASLPAKKQERGDEPITLPLEGWR
jgi:hypothetical protein